MTSKGEGGKGGLRGRGGEKGRKGSGGGRKGEGIKGKGKEPPFTISANRPTTIEWCRISTASRGLSARAGLSCYDSCSLKHRWLF